MKQSLFLLLLLICLDLNASIADVDVTVNFRPAVFATDLTSKSVSQTFQDSTGALWFVALEGLNRYNGYELENFRSVPGNAGTLSSDNVTRIDEDSTGNIWIATLGGGLNRYDPLSGLFTTIYANPGQPKGLLSNDVNTLFVSRNGTVWLGHRNAFSSYDPESQQFIHYISNGESTPALGEVIKFTEAEDGTLWIATTEAGLLTLVPESHELSVYSGPSHLGKNSLNDLADITIDSRSRLWIASVTKGASVIDLRNNTIQRFRHQGSNLASISSDTVHKVFEDAEGNIWLGTQEGISVYNEESKNFVRINTANANLPSSQIYSIYQSEEGQYWVGTYDGLAMGTKVLFPKYDVGNTNLSSESVNAFAETGDGSIWVGTDDGLNRLRPEHQSFEWINQFTYPGISSPRVMSLLGEDEIIWVGTFDGGLNKVDIKTNKVEVFRSADSDANAIAANGITSIIRGNDDKLYIGTFGGGLSVYDENSRTFTNYRNDPTNSKSISSDRVIALYQDSLGTIWIGTERGLNGFDPKSRTFSRIFSERNNNQSLSDDMVWAFFEDSNQTLWLGTNGGGLNSWDIEQRVSKTNYFTHYGNNASLPSSHIYGIQPSQNGKLWLSHNDGISLLTPDTLEVKHFGVRDGLQDKEFNMGASFKSSTGDVFFGGNLGYNIIDNESFSEESTPPKVSISEIRILNERATFNEPYNKLHQINLTYRDTMISFEYFAAHYTNPDLIKYAYQLVGINDDWVISESSRVANFTTLPPGSYTLKLAAATPGGTWNWNGASIPIIVSPPPWLSTPAYIAYFALFIALIFTIYHRSRRQAELAKRRQSELEAKVFERTQDLEEARHAAESANNAKSEFLATISHEIRTPLHGMIGMTDLLLHTSLTEQQRKFADAAHNSGEALLNLINEILDYSKIEADKVVLENTSFDLPKLIEDTCFLQAELSRRKGVQLHSAIMLPYNYRCEGDPTKLRQVLMNLISNAIKFTHEGSIDVTVSEVGTDPLEEQLIRFEVRDSGIGMDEKTITRVFEPFTQADASTTREYGGTGLGLTISRQYIQLMGGDVNVESKLGHGTKVYFDIPLKCLHKGQFEEHFRYKDAIIFCANIDRATMIESQLKRVGISSSLIESGKIELPHKSSSSLIFVDELTFKEELEKLDDLPDSAPGIILSSTGFSNDKDHLLNWPYVESPLTVANISSTLAKISNENNVRHESVEPFASTEQQPKSAKVLVAEDLETNQRIVREMLQLLGHEVEVVGNGKQAFEIFKENDFDIIFMDCQMPVMDGFKASSAIRTFEKENAVPHTPIVALSAGATSEDLGRAYACGMNDYVSKPFTLEDLTGAIEGYCSTFRGSPNSENHSFTPTVRMNTKLSSIEAGNDQGESELIILSSVENIVGLETQTGKVILPKIFTGFKDQFCSQLLSMKSAAKEGDMKLVYQAAHAIKSMSANIGSAQVRTIAANIEENAKSNSRFDLDTSINQLNKAYNEFIEAFDEQYISKYSREL